jgi:hypothetical protein
MRMKETVTTMIFGGMGHQPIIKMNPIMPLRTYLDIIQKNLVPMILQNPKNWVEEEDLPSPSMMMSSREEVR